MSVVMGRTWLVTGSGALALLWLIDSYTLLAGFLFILRALRLPKIGTLMPS